MRGQSGHPNARPLWPLLTHNGHRPEHFDSLYGSRVALALSIDCRQDNGNKFIGMDYTIHGPVFDATFKW